MRSDKSHEHSWVESLAVDAAEGLLAGAFVDLAPLFDDPTLATDLKVTKGHNFTQQSNIDQN